MPVLVDLKRAAFRQLFSSAVTAANVKLVDALATAAAPSLASALAGKQVIEAHAGDIITKYQLPAGLAAQTPDVAAMWGQLQDLYDLALQPTTNVPPGGGLPAETTNLPSTEGTAIYTWIMGRLKVVRSFSTDHTLSNFR